jgi:penicillin-insensitive murein DD-endopeptidase
VGRFDYGRLRHFGSFFRSASLKIVLVRAVLALMALALGGCAELGLVTDGGSIAYGRPNRGRLIDGVKLPDQGPGYTTAAIWRHRGNRWGTDELVGLLKGVSRRIKKPGQPRLVIADLSGMQGGAAHAFHRSHQNGRDVDILYFLKDAQGKPIEPDVMHVLDGKGVARDGSGITLDVPRTWRLVRELLTAQEAYVQYIFVYRTFAEKLLEHAIATGEPEAVIMRATRALKQPGDSAPHNDHMHVRIYCPPSDRMYGCVDIGPLEMLAEREMEARMIAEAVVGSRATVASTQAADAVEDNDGEERGQDAPRTAADVWRQSVRIAMTPPAAPAAGPATTVTSPAAVTSLAAPAAASALPFASLLRASSHHVDLRGWR